MNKKFCPLPWIFQAVRNNGDIRVCCQANPSQSKGIYRKEDGSAFNASKDSLTESRNSELAKDIRLSMLNNQTHEACIRCDREDASGIRSRRQYENENWDSYFNLETATQVTNKDGSIDTDKVPVVYYDLRFGNLCNLKCRMCGPTDSSMWYEDHAKVWNEQGFDDSHGRVELVLNDKGKLTPKNNDYDWVNSVNFWDQIKENVSNIKHIHTVGGEPLLIDSQYDLLQACIDQGVSKNITIEYNSNITNIPQRAWNIWKHFKKVNIGASIDGFGSVNDYIRHPSKWKQIEKNLRKLDEAEGNFNVWIACTIQIYNVFHLPDFMRWKLEQGFKRVNGFSNRRILTTHPLHNPRHLNVRILPLETKKEIINKYHKFYFWLEDWLNKNIDDEIIKEQYRNCAHDILDGISDYMLKEDWSDTLPKFVNYNKSLDRFRTESLKHSIPELYDALKKRHVL